MNAPYKTLPLGKSGKVALVDAADYMRVRRWSWHLSNGHVCRHTFPNAGAMRLSHEVLKLSARAHARFINGNRLDCRRANLQVRNGGTQKIKGTQRSPYRVQISVDCLLFHVGCYPTPRAAEQIRQIAGETAARLRGRGLTRKQIQYQLDLATGRRVKRAPVRAQQSEARAA
jgi:hypothetical protein